MSVITRAYERGRYPDRESDVSFLRGPRYSVVGQTQTQSEAERSMPIQNVGTLLENIVVTEAAFSLLPICTDGGGPVEFLNAFAMPPFSEWRPHRQNAGFDPAVLDRVRSTDLANGIVNFAALFRACLLSNPGSGPSSAMLVGGAARLSGCRCRMWLNDIPDGHYGNAVPALQEIDKLIAAAFTSGDAEVAPLEVVVSDSSYPDSLSHLSCTLDRWSVLGEAASRLAFLDPLRYRIRDRLPAETSSEDHRRWLRLVAFDQPTLAVHFTGHRDHPSLENELGSLHDDAKSEGYSATRAFKREHYVVFVAVRGSQSVTGEALANAVEERTRTTWADWCHSYTRFRNSDLRVYRNGRAD